MCVWGGGVEEGIDELSWNIRNLHNRAAESHEILSECSHQ